MAKRTDKAPTLMVLVPSGLETNTLVSGKMANRNGQGTLTWASGDKYVGEWKDGKRNGQGTYTYTSGAAQEGIWKDNEFLNAQKKSELDEHKDFCTEIGLTPKTEKFGDCVLKLMDEARRRQRTLKN